MPKRRVDQHVSPPPGYVVQDQFRAILTIASEQTELIERLVKRVGALEDRLYRSKIPL